MINRVVLCGSDQVVDMARDRKLTALGVYCNSR